VADAADAEDLEVYAARLRDGLLVRAAVGGEVGLRDRAGRNVDVLLPDVHVLEEVLLHPGAVRLEGRRGDGPVLVEAERDDARKVQALVAMQASQFAVHVQGRVAGREAQHGRPALGIAAADEVKDAAGDDAAGGPVVGVNLHGDAFNVHVGPFGRVTAP
jgi:hypothetical protein